MAKTAGIAGEWIVLVGLHETRGTGAVCVVTLATVDFRAAEAKVKSAERGIVAIVAGQALVGDRAGQQRLDFAVVRLVASQTIAVRRRSMRMITHTEFADVAVTSDAEASWLVRQQRLDTTAVRQVAGAALAGRNRRMRAHGGCRQGCVVAGSAEFGLSFYEQALLHRGMRQMAGTAFSRLCRRMHKICCLCITDEGLVTGATGGIPGCAQQCWLRTRVRHVAAHTVAGFDRHV